MALLSVNVNKIGTLRNSRGGDCPNVAQVAMDIERFGAQGITVHPRPDGRHIRRQDVFDIAKSIQVELNIEGYPSDDLLALVEEIRPAQCTLVPDPPDVLTSNAGWLVEQHAPLLRQVINRLHACGTRVSLFIDPYDYDQKSIAPIVDSGADRIELYTESYAKAFATPSQNDVLAIFARVGEAAHRAGLGINAGHDLSADNLRLFASALPFLDEVSIGHALICDALYWGLEETVKRYLAQLQLAKVPG